MHLGSAFAATEQQVVQIFAQHELATYGISLFQYCDLLKY